MFLATGSGLNEENAISQLHFNFSLEYIIVKDQENWMGFKLNVTEQHLFHVNDVNLGRNDINGMKKRYMTLARRLVLKLTEKV
jgi:hypothetical protein